MRKNELARFLVRAEYAFGDLGCPPRIPPEATSMSDKIFSWMYENVSFENTAFCLPALLIDR